MYTPEELIVIQKSEQFLANQKLLQKSLKAYKIMPETFNDYYKNIPINTAFIEAQVQK